MRGVRGRGRRPVRRRRKRAVRPSVSDWYGSKQGLGLELAHPGRRRTGRRERRAWRQRGLYWGLQFCRRRGPLVGLLMATRGSRPGQQAGRRAAAAGQPCWCASSAASRGVTSALFTRSHWTVPRTPVGVALGGPRGLGLPRDSTHCSNARLCRQCSSGVASGSRLPGCHPDCGYRAGAGLSCVAALRPGGARAGCAGLWQPNAGPVPRLPAKLGGRGRTGAGATGQVAAAHSGALRASKVHHCVMLCIWGAGFVVLCAVT